MVYCSIYLLGIRIQPRSNETVKFMAQWLGDGAASKICSRLYPSTAETPNRMLEKGHNYSCGVSNKKYLREVHSTMLNKRGELCIWIDDVRACRLWHSPLTHVERKTKKRKQKDPSQQRRIDNTWHRSFERLKLAG